MGKPNGRPWRTSRCGRLVAIPPEVGGCWGRSPVVEGFLNGTEEPKTDEGQGVVGEFPDQRY